MIGCGLSLFQEADAVVDVYYAESDETTDRV